MEHGNFPSQTLTAREYIVILQTQTTIPQAQVNIMGRLQLIYHSVALIEPLKTFGTYGSKFMNSLRHRPASTTVYTQIPIHT